MAGPLGASPGIILGVGIGTAAAAAIEPAVELPRQKAWSENAVRVLDPGVLARLVAQGGIALGTAEDDARLEGFAADKLDALVYLAQTVPGFAEALTLWRRAGGPGSSFDGLWDHSLVKQGLDARYLPELSKLVQEWLTPSQVALAIVRSLLPDPGLMPVDLDTSGGVVPRYPVANIDPLVEAFGGGVDRERLRVLVGSIGLPMSTQQAASATFRKIIERGDFNRSILEGDVRPEWAEAIFEQARQILSAHDYAELHLRGWLPTVQEMYDGTAKHGMSEADTDLLFKVLGRPIPLHQVVTGLARGGTYNGPIDQIPTARLKSMQESNVRPEWYSLDDANRYSYPSAFFFRLLIATGVLTADEGYQRFLEIGWAPDLARQIADALAASAGGAGAKTDPHVVKAQGQLWTAMHKAFVKTGVARATLEQYMQTFVPGLADRDAIFQLWTDERAVDAAVV